MEIGSIFLLFSLTILVGLFILRPFYESRRIGLVSAEEHTLSSLMAERDRLLTALQELDFDNILGKIPAQDYPTQRALLVQQAAQVLRQLDELQQAQPALASDAESRVEAVVASRRADAAAEKEITNTLSDDDIESLIAARRATRKGKSAGFCSKCGKPILRTDQFCPGCGNPLKAG